MTYYSPVYQESNFYARVQFAASVIARGGGRSRNFDACFEMFDADEVAAALYRRIVARPNGRLAQNYDRFADLEMAKAAYEATRHLTLEQLAEQAGKSREVRTQEALA